MSIRRVLIVLVPLDIAFVAWDASVGYTLAATIMAAAAACLAYDIGCRRSS